MSCIVLKIKKNMLPHPGYTSLSTTIYRIKAFKQNKNDNIVSSYNKEHTIIGS